MTKKVTQKSNINIEITDELTDFVRDYLERKLPQKEFAWLHNRYVYLNFDHLLFTYKNKLFSVLIDITDNENFSTLSEDDLKMQSDIAEKYNLIPCIFPINTKSVHEFDVSNSKITGFNLYNTTTGEPIIPTDIANDEPVEMSEWELNFLGIRYFILFLQSRHCTINFWQDRLDMNPQIWFKEPTGKHAWAIVRINQDNDYLEKNNEEIQKIIKQGYRNNGYFVNLLLSSSNEDKKIYRQDNVNIKLTQMEQIHSTENSDLLTKNNILEEDAYSIVINSITKKPADQTDRTFIFNIPNYSELLLKTNLDFIKTLDKNLSIVPIKYEQNIADNPNFGFPLYQICQKDSIHAKNGYILPEESIHMKTKNISIIKKVGGMQISLYYRSNLYDLVDDNEEQVKLMTDIKSKFGCGIAIKTLNYCKNGINNIKKNKLILGSDNYNFIDGKKFYSDYIKLKNNFLFYVKLLSVLPQDTYTRAVNNILSAKNFVFDFDHPNNILLDYQTKEFNFIDPLFEKIFLEEFPVKAQIERFRNVLLGHSYVYPVQPKDLLYSAEDIELFNSVSDELTKRINSVCPAEDRIEDDYHVQWE
ncbi:MAG: hypothetical protein K6E29_03200 [Cyanobacteria bacterium RUI128]|nr:hypothetical protein [Cyanobacteria bacterium RUI128]